MLFLRFEGNMGENPQKVHKFAYTIAMRFLRVLLPVLVLGILALAPFATFAADTSPLSKGWTIYPDECLCDKDHNIIDGVGVESAPDFACVIIVVHRLMNLAISLGVVIFVLVSSYAGVLWMTSAVNPGNREKGRSMLMNAVVGLLIALSAWLLVDFVMKALYNSDTTSASGAKWGPWNEILSGNGQKMCLEVSKGPAVPATPTTPDGGVVATPGGGGTTVSGCPSCTLLSGLGISAKPAARAGSVCGASGYACMVGGGCDGVAKLDPPVQGCLVNEGFGSKLKSALRSGMWVTEAWPPTTNHSNACHTNGTCVDVDYKDNRTDAESVNAFINAAVAEGLGPVYELGSVAACKQVRDAGVPEKYLDVVSGVDPHFSVYNSSKGTQPGCK